jgi:hypothetical protein
MPLLAQSGYGRGEKIEKGLDAESIRGVILSPRDESPDRLESFCAELSSREDSPILLVDPQFYATTLRNARDGNLPAYPYYGDNCALSRNQFRPSQIEDYVKDCLDYQLGLNGLSYIVSPTVSFDGFRDFWSQIAINMAEASADYHARERPDPPLLISVVLSEGALRYMEQVNEFLDALSTLEVHGFYLLVQRNSSAVQHAMEPVPMANLMYFIHVLGRLNGYEVISGYSDWLGFLLEAAGASMTASGWHNGLKQFSLNRFLPQSGGRRPRKRYSSLPLLSSPLVVPELEEVYLASMLPLVLTGGSHDHLLDGGPANGEPQWTEEVACLAHWESLARLLGRIEAISDVPTRLDNAVATIHSAQSLYTRLKASGIIMDPQTGPDHLDDWLNSIAAFRQEAGV